MIHVTWSRTNDVAQHGELAVLGVRGWLSDDSNKVMGNINGAGSTTLHGESKLAAQKFDTDEIHVLRKTWQDLADRHNGKGIDKETFLQYFPLNGLLGERLFAQFDVKKAGIVDFDDFILGLATVCR